MRKHSHAGEQLSRRQKCKQRRVPYNDQLKLTVTPFAGRKGRARRLTER
jgi:hypothetical protein